MGHSHIEGKEKKEEGNSGQVFYLCTVCSGNVVGKDEYENTGGIIHSKHIGVKV